MNPLICPNPSCGSADIRQTTTGLFRNSYICNKCSRAFARLAGANIVMPTVPPTLMALGAGIKNIVDSLDGSSKKSGRPPQPTRPPVQHHHPGAVPPRPHPGVPPPPDLTNRRPSMVTVPPFRRRRSHPEERRGRNAPTHRPVHTRDLRAGPDCNGAAGREAAV
jgi:hypothetical protein